MLTTVEDRAHPPLFSRVRPPQLRMVEPERNFLAEFKEYRGIAILSCKTDRGRRPRLLTPRSWGLDSRHAASHLPAMWFAFASGLAFVLLAAAVGAEERPQGLLWNRSGLPATLPLQVRTEAEADFLVHLREIQSGEEILAAYIRGGEFFRVLVPPGRYEVVFTTGTDWQGEAALFGPDTHRFELEEPLEFRAGLNRKSGHLIDLRMPDDVSIRDFAICQRLVRDPESLRRPLTRAGRPFRQTDRSSLSSLGYPMPRYDLLARICD